MIVGFNSGIFFDFYDGLWDFITEKIFLNCRDIVDSFIIGIIGIYRKLLILQQVIVNVNNHF